MLGGGVWEGTEALWFGVRSEVALELYMRQGVSESSDPFLRLPLIANTWLYFDYTFAQWQKCQAKKIEGLKCALKLSLGTAFVSDSKIF